MDKKKKNALVLWSGGFDSTTLIFHYLEQGYTVYALPSIIKNNECQTSAEKYARCQIMNLFQKNNLPVYLLEPTTLYVSTNDSNVEGVTQPLMWLTTLFFNVGNSSHPYDVIGFGYVKQDDFWHYKGDFINTWKSMLGLRDHKNSDIPIEFPFEWESKESLAQKYWKGKKEYFQFISSSELGTHWSMGPTDDKNKELRNLWSIISLFPDEKIEVNTSPQVLKTETVTGEIDPSYWKDLLKPEPFDWNRPLVVPDHNFIRKEEIIDPSKIICQDDSRYYNYP